MSVDSIGIKGNCGISKHYPMVSQAIGTSITVVYGNSYHRQISSGLTLTFRFGEGLSIHQLISSGKGWIVYAGNGNNIHSLSVSSGVASTCNFGQTTSEHALMQSSGNAHNASINIGNSIHSVMKNTGLSLANISSSNLTFNRCSLGSVNPTIESATITPLHYERCS